MQDVLARCEELALKFVFGKDETVPPLSVTGAPAAPMSCPRQALATPTLHNPRTLQKH